ncbi:MAG: enoyl-CoA hydratase-related protein [Chitinophagales bacterium]|nr:enoyl-CoA hydratase-related protein [Chitinophagales bacterium]MDW8419847.1 enoyl-CoA hydratase-related protein [Chitinophagales bacterium]
MKSYQTLLTELDDKGIFTITINREDKLNALNKTVISELNDAVDEIYQNSAIKGAIITGKGIKSFVAGADISEFKGMTEAEGKALAQRGHDVFDKIELCPKPIIAAVNGFALGGGCELAMACHLRIASENAKFGQPEVKLGIIPGYGGTQRLTQLIGKGKALELLMTGDTIDAACAAKLGLVNDVVQTVELLDACKAMLQKITSMAPFAIAQVIQSVYAHFKDGINGFDTEIELFGKCVATEDFAEGTAAFLEKRKPVFKGK